MALRCLFRYVAGPSVQQSVQQIVQRLTLTAAYLAKLVSGGWDEANPREVVQKLRKEGAELISNT